MDSWRYLPDGKNILLSEDLDHLPVDGIASTQHTSMEWETKPSYGIKTYPLPSNSGPVVNSSGFMGLGFSERCYSSDPSTQDMARNSIDIESSKELYFPGFNASNLVAPSEGSSGRISNFFMESNGQDSLMFDLKLGGFANSVIAKDSQLLTEGMTSKLSNASSPSPAKRGRSTSLNLQTPLCQVHGCNKDLTSFKDYYKRHKVCEAHTKTAKVIVSGIEQRFCQQCSRFHLLEEFDEGKRSCRKRLADHNERRRKPQLIAGSGSSFLESSILRGSSSSLPDMLPTDTFGCSKYENGKFMGHINFEASTTSLKAVPADNVSSGVHKKLLGTAACNAQDAQHSSRALSLLSDCTQDIPTHLLRSQSTSQLMTKMNWDMNNSEFVNNEDGHHHLGGGTMVNMHQLSSHLRRVEQQRNSDQVRPPDNLFNTFPSSEGE